MYATKKQRFSGISKHHTVKVYKIEIAIRGNNDTATV